MIGKLAVSNNYYIKYVEDGFLTQEEERVKNEDLGPHHFFLSFQ